MNKRISLFAFFFALVFAISQFHYKTVNKSSPYSNQFTINFDAAQVLRILAWDTLNHLVYYLGTHEKKPGQQHLYVVKDPINEDPRR